MLWINTGLLTSTGDKWRKRRKMITPTFHFKILEQFVEIFDRNANILIKKLDNVVGEPSVDIFEYISLCALDIICETAMGVSQNAQEQSESEFVKALSFLTSNAIKRAFSLIEHFDFTYKFTNTFKQERKCLEIVHSFTESMIRKRRKYLMENNLVSETDEHNLGIRKKQPFLDMLLQAQVDGKPLSDLDIREEVDTFAFTGHDTSTSAISFALYCLSQNPEVQRKAFEEINTLACGDKERSFQFSELQEMKYLNLVIKETLRMYPSAPFIGRDVSEEFEYNGYTFLKGSTMIIFINGLHMNPKYYEDPEIFRPERWIEGKQKRGIFTYVPFSAGPRNCIGQKFANLEIKTIISKILMHYELLPSKVPHELVLSNEAVLKSKTGVKMYLKKRTY